MTNTEKRTNKLTNRQTKEVEKKSKENENTSNNQYLHGLLRLCEKGLQTR